MSRLRQFALCSRAEPEARRLLIPRSMSLWEKLRYTVLGARNLGLVASPSMSLDTMTIRFRIDTRKALEAILWLVSQRPGLTRHSLAKILYYADKRHLQEYGRPVIGDRYIAMREGMVPSHVLDILERDGAHLRPDELEVIDRAIEQFTNAEGYPAYRSRRPPDTNFLSRTDQECLDWSLEEFADKGFEELKEIAHQEAAWRKAWEHEHDSPMDYEDIIDADNPRREILIEKLRETSRSVAF